MTVKRSFSAILAVFLIVAITAMAGVALYAVWKAGLLNFEETLGDSDQPNDLWSVSEETGGPVTGVVGNRFPARVFCVVPEHGLLFPEDREIPSAPDPLSRLINVIEALRVPPLNPNLVPALTADIQIRNVFYDSHEKTVYVNLDQMPSSWRLSGPVHVGLCLYSMTYTITGLSSDFEAVRFLVDGRECNQNPGGFLLCEAYQPSDDWLAVVDP